jgi:ribosomal protein L11 methyltransferase
MPPITPTFRWSKLAAAKWEDAWVERLQFLGRGRLAIFSLPGSRRIRIEAYGLKTRQAARLVEAFGGQARKMKALPAAPADETAPLLIRDRLVVVRSPRAARAAARLHPGRTLLVIPAAMAFGTGDHATTATCLRLVSDFAVTRAGLRWEALDLGTGTGILALAARLLGAARCDAWDNDPACIRAVRHNARLNHLRNVPAARVDATLWTPTRQWDLVTANLFSEMLIKVSPAIVAALKPDGCLILSGMLAHQAEETLATFRARGLAFPRLVKKGKWVTALGAWHDPARPPANA